MNWIHCNKCSKAKNDNSSNGESFYVASCFHIFCQSCFQNVCCICKKQFRAVLINDSMPNNVKSYFQCIHVLARNLQKAMKFQIEQRRIFDIQNVNVFNIMSKMQNTKQAIMKRRSYLILELKKETERLQQLKEKQVQLEMLKKKREMQTQFMNEFRDKSGYLNKSLGSISSRNRSIPLSHSFSPVPRSFSPSTLARISLDSFCSNQESVNSDKKEFYVTPRNTFVTQNVRSAQQIQHPSVITTPHRNKDHNGIHGNSSSSYKFFKRNPQSHHQKKFFMNSSSRNANKFFTENVRSSQNRKPLSFKNHDFRV